MHKAFVSPALALLLGVTGFPFMCTPAPAAFLSAAWDANNSAIYSLDEASGTGARVGLAGINDLNLLARNSTGIFYAVGGTSNNSLVTIDPTNGAATVMATLSNMDFRGLAFSANDTLFAVQDGISNNPDKLVKINVNTGAVTLVGNIGYIAVQDIALRAGWNALRVEDSSCARLRCIC
jgi:hypothetical protein